MAKGKLKCELILIGIVLLASILWGLSCDDRNIVEPRFSSDNDTEPIFNHEQYQDSIVFGVDVWESTYVDAIIINDSGEIIKDIYHQNLPPGSYRYAWKYIDNNGNTVENGNYCYSYWSNERHVGEGNIWIKVDR
jgi:hypothetical protein